MTYRIHIPRSAIRAARDFGAMGDPFDDAIAAATGMKVVTYEDHVVLPDSTRVPLSRSARRAISRYDWQRLDAPVRFQLTIEE